MKNLKKVLALVLAFACAFTMFASAAFTDQADIKNSEAVDMLSALGIIKGYSDGSYKPDKVVTRAEMAKMIYVIRNGGSDVVSQYEGYKTPFTDVENVNHWAKGYIAFCYANGIIAGKSATKFVPDAPVTGQEAAKMGLVMLGYDPARAGLVGKAWATNTTNLATQKDLFKDYSNSITVGAPRQFAAQLLYNTLWACTVKWSEDAKAYEDVVVYEGSSNGVNAKPLNVTVAKKYMGLEEVTGIFEGNNKLNDGLKNTESKVDGKTITFVPENGNDWLGESVKVLYKENKDGVDGLDHHDTIYGLTLSGNTTVVRATLGDLGDVDGKKIKVGDTKYDVYDTGMDVQVNFVNKGKQNAANFTQAYKQDSADAVKFIQNKEGKVTAAYINHAVFTKVTGLTEKKISLAGIGTLDINDDMDLDKNVAKNDIVSVTTLYEDKATTDGAFNVIAKADVVKDVKVTNKKGQEVMIDGKYAKNASYNMGTMDSDYVTDVKLDDVCDFVMYGNYWVAAKKVEASAKEIALLTGKGDDGLDERVKVMFMDGSEKTYAYDNDDDKNLYGKLEVGQIYSYTMVGDSKIQLTQKDTSSLKHKTMAVSATATKVYDADRKTLFLDGKNYVVAKEAMAFINVPKPGTDGKQINKFYAYNIDAIKSIDKADVVAGKNVEFFENGDGEIVAFIMNTTKKPGAASSNEQYGYIVDDPSSTSVDGTTYTELSIWNGKETVAVKVEVDKLDNFNKGDFVQFAVGANGISDKSDLKLLTKGNLAAVSAFDESRSLLTIYNNKNDVKGGTTAYKLTKDCVVIGVNTSDRKAAEGYDAIIKADYAGASTTKVENNILYVMNKDGDVVAVFVDSNNKMEEKHIESGDAFVAE